MSKPSSNDTGGVRHRHPSGSHSLGGSIASNAQAAEEKLEHALLILWDDLPDWRRDNVFIRSGYRSTRDSYRHSLLSLFYLHNESVNIWSHLIGAIVAVLGAAYLYNVVHPRYETSDSSDVLVFGCFIGGAVLCLGMSATYHAVTNHSESVAKWGNKLDYTGIVALIVGSYVPALYYGLYCQPRLMSFYLGLVRSVVCCSRITCSR
jgi:adiponectin receptor